MGQKFRAFLRTNKDVAEELHVCVVSPGFANEGEVRECLLTIVPTGFDFQRRKSEINGLGSCFDGKRGDGHFHQKGDGGGRKGEDVVKGRNEAM